MNTDDAAEWMHSMAMDTSGRFTDDAQLGPLFARPSDPITSQIAAADLETRLSGLRAKFVAGVAKLGTATAKEAAKAVGGENAEYIESIRKRAKECVELGVVRIAGKRQCAISGNASQVYEVVE